MLFFTKKIREFEQNITDEKKHIHTWCDIVLTFTRIIWFMMDIHLRNAIFGAMVVLGNLKALNLGFLSLRILHDETMQDVEVIFWECPWKKRQPYKSSRKWGQFCYECHSWQSKEGRFLYYLMHKGCLQLNKPSSMAEDIILSKRHCGVR